MRSGRADVLRTQLNSLALRIGAIAFLLTKIDLLPHLDFDVAAVEDGLARVMPTPRVIRLSARSGEGVACRTPSSSGGWIS